MIGCFPTQALAFSPVSIQTQRTQRKRLRLDGNRALGYYTLTQKYSILADLMASLSLSLKQSLLIQPNTMH